MNINLLILESISQKRITSSILNFGRAHLHNYMHLRNHAMEIMDVFMQSWYYLIDKVKIITKTLE
jgi:hypothetical protein